MLAKRTLSCSLSRTRKHSSLSLITKNVVDATDRKHKQNGNAKPWRDAGIPAPMGRRRGTKCGLKTPPPAPAKKTPERKEPTTPTRQRATTPSRQQKRVAQKKKLNASARATPARKTPAWSTTSSPPALTIDTSFSTPGSQMQLPDGRTLTPSAFGFTGDDDNNNTNGTMNMHGNTSFGENASLPNYNAYGGLPSHLNGVGAGFDGWGDEFQTMNNGLLGHNFNGVIPGYEGLANGWDGTMRGLDLANNVGYDDSFSNIDRFGNDYTVANNSFSYNNNEEEIAFPDAKPTASAAGTHGLPEKATPQDVVLINQLCDAYAAPNHPTTMNGNAHDELTHSLHETLLVQLAAGNLSNDQALQVLNNVAANFKHA